MIRAHLARFGYPLPPQNNEEALCNRAAMIFLTMKREADPDTRKSPTYVPTTGIKQTKAMEYAGYPDEAIHGKSAEYAKVTRRYKKLQLSQAREEAAAREAHPEGQPDQPSVPRVAEHPAGNTQGLRLSGR